MKKLGPDVVNAAEYIAELSKAVHQLGELAVALQLPRPIWVDEFDKLSESKLFDQWVVGRGRLGLIDTAWNDIAATLVDQALATEVVLPASSVPKL